MSPALTTVRQLAGELGASAIDIALQLMEDKPPARAVLPVELVFESRRDRGRSGLEKDHVK